MSSGILSILALAVLSTPTQDRVQVETELKLPAQGVKVGSSFHLIIEAKHKTGGIALIPESLSLPESIAERVEQRRHLRTKDQEQEIDRYEVELVAFEPGEFDIPPIEVAYSSTVASTRPLKLLVSSDLTEQEQLIASSTLPQAIAELEKMAAPNPGSVDIMVEDFTLVYAFGAIILALLGLIVGRWLYRKYQQSQKEQAEAVPVVPARPAHEIAFERLEALRTSDYLANNDFKSYFVELSEILRSYVGARYEFDSVELTVFELIACLRDLRTPGLDLAQFERMLNDADFVKFAKYLPTDTEAHSALNGSFELIERTAKRMEDAHAAS